MGWVGSLQGISCFAQALSCVRFNAWLMLSSMGPGVYGMIGGKGWDGIERKMNKNENGVGKEGDIKAVKLFIARSRDSKVTKDFGSLGLVCTPLLSEMKLFWST